MATTKDKEFAKVTVSLGFLKQETISRLWRQYEQQSYYKSGLTFAQWLVKNEFLSLAQVAAVEHHFINLGSLDEDSREIDIQMELALKSEDYFSGDNKVQTIDDVDFDDLPKSVVSTVFDNEDEDIENTKPFLEGQKIPQTKFMDGGVQKSQAFFEDTHHVPQTLFEGNTSSSNKKPHVPQTLFEGNTSSNDKKPHVPQTLFEGNTPSNGKVSNVPQTLFEGNMPSNDKIPNVPQTLFEGNMPSNDKLPNLPQTLFEGNMPSSDKMPNVPQTLFEGNTPSNNQIPQTLFEGNSGPKLQGDAFLEDVFSPSQGFFPETKLEGGKSEFNSDEVLLVQSEFSQGLTPKIKPGKKFGQYDVIGEVGRGGMGKVYKVYDSTTKKILALKVLMSTEERENEKMGRFLREAFLSSKFNHPNIVAAHDIGNEEGQVFFTMDFIQGKTLDEVLKEKTFSRRQMIEMMIKIAQAVSHAHSKKIIHRDLKPGNIIITENNEPKVMDFGLAKIVNEDSKLSKSGMIIGTVHYMPPEQADGLVKELDERSDTYALGAILYELITGCTPFKGESFSEIIDQILYRNPIPPSKIVKRVHRDLEKICLKAIEKEKEDRYQTADEFIQDLGLFLRGQKINIKNTFWPKISRKIENSLRTKRTKFSLAFASLVFICLFLIMSVFEKQEGLLPKEIHFALVDEQKREVKVFSVGKNIHLLVEWPQNKEVIKNQIYLQVYGNMVATNQYIYREKEPTHELFVPLTLLTDEAGKYSVTSQIKIGDLEKKNILTFEIKSAQIKKEIIPQEEKILSFDLAIDRGDLRRTGKVDNYLPFEHDYRIVLSRKISASFFAAPIIHQNVIYAGCLKGVVYALDYKNIKFKWTFPADSSEENGRILSSPTLAGEYIYVGNDNGILYALDKNSGKLKWRFPTGRKIHCSPLIEKTACYFGSGDKLYCLNRFTGNLIWSFQLQGKILSSAAIDKKIIYFGDYSGSFYAVNADNGALLWRQKVTGRITSTPTITNENVYFASREGDIYSLKITDGSVKWKYRTSNEIHFSSPTIVDNNLYCGGFSGIHIINIYSGKRILFIPTKRRVYSSAYHNNNGIVYISSDEARMYAIDNNSLKLKPILIRKNGQVGVPFTIKDKKFFFTSMDGRVLILK